MTTMVGFDVAKKTVVAAVVGGDHRTLVPPITLENTEVVLEEWLRSQLTRYGALALTCESTSYYHYASIRACGVVGLSCRVLNPIVTKQATKATIRGKKTDASDALLIARLGLRGEGVLTTGTGSDSKVLLRVSDKLQTVRHSVDMLEQSLMERGVMVPAATAALYGRVLGDLNLLIASCRQTAIAAIAPDTIALLTSIPGVGQKTAATLVAELGDITRFRSINTLVAYAGLDPRVRQSGTSLHRNTRLTKRGSPSLRRAIFLAANVARRYDPEMQAYYQRKRIEGRTYTEAMMPVCRRLLARVYAIWKRQTPYEKRETA